MLHTLLLRLSLFAVVFSLTALSSAVGFAATIPVGAGSYVDELPTGQAGPPTTIHKTANVTGAVPTNDWYSSVPAKGLSNNMFADPLALRTTSTGLAVSNPWMLVSDPAQFPSFYGRFREDLRLGLSSIASVSDVQLDGYSDWTADFKWNTGSASLTTRAGHGFPYIYSTFSGGNPRLVFPAVPTVFSGSASTPTLGVTINGNNYGLFCPAGGSWSGIGTTALVCNPNGKSYFSLALLPSQSALTVFAAHAFAFPSSTRATGAYDSSNSTVSTRYDVTVDSKDGAQTSVILGLYPHQWKTTSAPLSSYSVDTPRGTMKYLVGNSFVTSSRFNGILPYLPTVDSADKTRLRQYVDSVANEGAPTLSDTYWSGKRMLRMANLIATADKLGDTTARDALVSKVESTLQNWLTASDGKNLFYYNRDWGTLIGYPASYGTNTELNDHDFHYGYFVYAAALIAQFDPAWAQKTKWGAMIDLLIKDYADPARADGQFPYLRQFDPYAGHTWASGFAPFADGNNSESSSESELSLAGIALWGGATGDTNLRNFGIWLYSLETQAVHEYWFDSSNTNFPSTFKHSAIARLWGSGGDHTTWWTNDPQQIHGIEWLPITGSSLYLCWNPDYARVNFNEMVSEIGSNPPAWQDIQWEFESCFDRSAALQAFNNNSSYAAESGDSRAHTYQWLAGMNELGSIDHSVTSNWPYHAVFTNGQTKTRIAYNPTAADVTVHFSDGADLVVGPRSIRSSNSAPPAPVENSFYPLSNGELSCTPGSAAATNTIAAANGNYDGTPHSQVIYRSSVFSGRYDSTKVPQFNLWVDSGANIGNAVQLRLTYAFGDGTQRVETYRYFATNDLAGWERYDQTKGLKSTNGVAFKNFTNGTVTAEVWSALGKTPSTLLVNAPTTDSRVSRIVIPYTDLTGEVVSRHSAS